MRMKTLISHRFLATLTVAALASVTLLAQDKKAETKVDISKLPPASDKKDVTYAKDIKPIMEKSCVKCHGNERPKAKLNLTTLDGILKGSENGKILEAGKSADSPMVHSVAWLGEEDFWMPPKGNKAKIPQLTKEEVGLIRAWIDQGAK